MTCNVSRRSLLKQMGTGAVALAAATSLARTSQAAHGDEASNDDAWGMLIDLTRCTGCQSCALACKAATDRPSPQRVPVALDSDAYSFVDERTVPNAAGDDETVYVKRQCMHCLHPACASVCTVGALRKTAEGPVIYAADKCIGCRYCQYACPFNVPVYEWEDALGLIHKCQMCISRLAEGELPACVGSCPNGALRFGKRAELLVQAHAQLRTNPGRYVDHVYGEHEAGGTSVLYLSAVPFADLGFPELDDQPIPRYAEAVMAKTPVIALTVASVVTGLHVLMQRRHLVQAQVPVQVERDQGGDR